MKHMDREYQRELLTKLADKYPHMVKANDLTGALPSDPRWVFNAQYLHEHELIDAPLARQPGAAMVREAVITAKGLDFLQGDGGLGAILSVVTVRLDADTLRALIEDRVDSAALPSEEKSQIKKWLRSAGQEGLKQATTRLVGAALDHAPEALQLLKTLTGLPP